MASTDTVPDRLRAALDAPVRIDVTGRAGVGRSTLIAALGPIRDAEVVETPAWDRPGAVDPVPVGDVVVLVLPGPPRGADREAAAAAGDRLVPVLTKADTLTDPLGVAARAGAALGTDCLAVAAIGAVTGLDAVRDELGERVVAVRAERAAAVLAQLRALAATDSLHDLVEQHLASDEGVRLAARATGVRGGSGDAAARARSWRVRLNRAPDAAAARAALVLHRAAVRDRGARD